MEFPMLGSMDKEDLATRRAGGKGKWHAADRSLRREAAVRAVITKTIHSSEEHPLGKRRMARLVSESSDGLAVEVPYSLNRKARWLSGSPESLLSCEQPDGAQVSVVEAVQARGSDMATAVHRLNADGTVGTARPNGYAAHPNTLRENAGKKRRNTRRSARNSKVGVGHRNEPNDLAESEGENEAAAEPGLRIDYTIQRTHINPRVAMKKQQKLYSRERRIMRRAGAFRVDPEDLMTSSEMEASIHDDTDTYKPSRDFRFCLADYMTAPVSNIEVVRRGSVEAPPVREAHLEDALKDVDEVLAKETLKSQPTFVDITTIANSANFFEAFELSTSQWKDFNFVEQVDGLKFGPRWLDADRRRVLIDATPLLKAEQSGRPLLYIVLERTRRNHIRAIINSLYAAPENYDKLKFQQLLEKSGPNGLADLIQASAAEVAKWVERAKPVRSTLPAARRHLHLGSANSRHLANAAHTIDEYSMAELLRKENELITDTFERLSSDEWSECDDEEFETVAAVRPCSVKCLSCECSDPAELFELDDAWQCRECLRHDVLHQIRSKNVPLHLTLVTAAGQSPYDVLPCLLPLPIVAFYTKIAATEILKDSGTAIGELTVCPGCMQTAHIDRPTDTTSCVCADCGILWCSACMAEPHWPLDCTQRAVWAEKFEKQYICESMRDQIDKHIRRITCECDTVIEVGDLTTSAECPECRLEFDPRTMTLCKPNFPYDSKARKDNLHGKPLPFYHKKIELIPPAQLIAKQFAEVCSWARGERLSEVKSAAFEKVMRKWDAKEVERAREARKTTLYLIEFGNAWLYLNRKEQSVRSALHNLQKNYEELCLDAERTRGSALARND
ncbi:unnamed protein product, partial [Mesorhabditis spiculigera]